MDSLAPDFVNGPHLSHLFQQSSLYQLGDEITDVGLSRLHDRSISIFDIRYSTAVSHKAQYPNFIRFSYQKST